MLGFATAIRTLFSGSCRACAAPLPVGDRAPMCPTCAIALVGCGQWQDNATWPAVGAFAYGGAMAELIGRMKIGGHLLDLTPLAAKMQPLLAELVGNKDVHLIAVPPQLQRLRRRGLHVPDLLTQQLVARSRRQTFALQRLDQAEMRRESRSILPEFAARIPGRGRLAVVIDDVITTGATLKVACTALQKADWRVLGAVCLADARPQAMHFALANG